jgi:hypothetical protein
MPSIDWSLLLDPGHWFDGNPGSASGWYWIPGLIFLAALGAGLYSYYYLRARRFASHSLHAHLAEVAGIAGISFGLWGLFLLLMRFWGVGLLSARILLYLTLLAGVGMIGYAIFRIRKDYPASLQAYTREEERKRFLPAPKAGRPKPKPAIANGAAKNPAAGRPGEKPVAHAGKHKPASKGPAHKKPQAAAVPAGGKK